MGLAIPQVTQLMHRLKSEGYPVFENAITVQEARKNLLMYFQGKKNRIARAKTRIIKIKRVRLNHVESRRKNCMIRDITIGQYYAAYSIIHKLDPRVKLAGTMLYIISLFTADGPICYLLAVFALAAVIHLSTVPFKFMARGLKSIVIILLITVSFNLFLTPGTSIIDVWLLRHITWEGLEKAVYMGIRLILLILGSSIMTLTTTPNALTDGLEKSLGFLKDQDSSA